MADEQLHHDENTLRKVYEALLESGIYGQQALDIVSTIQNKGILFRENKPKRRGRPPKETAQPTPEEVEKAWAPPEVDNA